ncbi:MAG: dTMP kinase [Alphaproteobacteria bacterium]|nr:dTMP kinase [Alphaproteobacteria bacterium]
MSAEGFFITFEGGEGSGKTTQINRLSRILTDNGRRVITTREPGGTSEGEKIRSLLVQREGGNWSAMAELLLLFAARTMHVEKIIRPALENGDIVISDRFTDSTRAYQGYGRGLEIDIVEQVNTLVLGDFKPDMTIILDVPPETGLGRSKRRLASEKFAEEGACEDRFEQLEIDFHRCLRQGFLEIAQSEPERCRIIDATDTEDNVAAQILALIKDRF